jgi:hypothetical protein
MMYPQSDIKQLAGETEIIRRRREKQAMYPRIIDPEHVLALELQGWRIVPKEGVRPKRGKKAKSWPVPMATWPFDLMSEDERLDWACDLLSDITDEHAVVLDKLGFEIVSITGERKWPSGSVSGLPHPGWCEALA